jgi:putative ABC transport system permease protein
MEIIEGRDFSKDLATDGKEAVILNESASRKFGWTSPIGKNIKTENKDGSVIGVVRDFHFQSLRQEIEPLVIYISPRFFEYISIRITPDNFPATLAFIKKKWKEWAPGLPFDYFFLDSDFDRFYRAEEREGRVFCGFSFLAIFIACLGLFGLASFTAEQRTKEIGIRKVLGATVPSIVTQLIKEFTKWVLIANFIAWPVGYFAMSRWLENFAYRTRIGPWTFLLSAILVFIIALLTVSFQALRAAFANPSDALRYE